MQPIVILAGGLATRLRPVTETVPKSLIEINEVPFVLHQLELLERKGFTEIWFCLGYLGEQVEKVVSESRFTKTLSIHYAYDGEKLLGTGGAIRRILPELPESFFITYGDSYLDVDYVAIESYYTQNKKGIATGLMTVFRNENKWDGSNVIYEQGRVILYSKKQKETRMNYIDYGVGILCKRDFAEYDEGITFDLSNIYEKLSRNNSLLGFEIANRFFEIGSFTGIEDISNYLKNKK